MKNLALAVLVLIAVGIYAVSQQESTGQTAKGASTSSTTVQGCLSRTDSNYTLTDKSGTRYQLAGDTSQLSDHVGHEVQISGTTAVSGEATTATKKMGPEINISNVKHISSTCQSKPASEKPPMSEKPPTSPKPPGPPYR